MTSYWLWIATKVHNASVNAADFLTKQTNAEVSCKF